MAKAAADKGKPNLAPLERNLARWKAAQFNLKVLDVRKAWKEKEAEREALLDMAQAAKTKADGEKARYDKLKAEYEKLKPKS